MSRRAGILLAVILGSASVFLDTTVVNVALPRIGQELPSHNFGVLEGQSYVYTGYLLTLSSLLIVAGAMADAIGRRRVFLVGLVGFGVTSAACALAPNLEALIALRILQGVAGALLVPASLAIMTASFQGEELGQSFGLWAGASAATTILGPFIGGIFVQTISWRAAFLINVPIIAIATWATWRYVPESSDPTADRRLDWLGAVLAAVSIAGLSFGTIYGQQRDWSDAVGPASIVAGVVAGALFLLRMARTSRPLVPLGLFRSRNFAVTNLSTLLIYGALYVSLYELGLFSQGVLGYSPAAAGLVGIPGSVALAVLASRMGTLGARYGPRRFMAVGPILVAAGVLWWARVPADSAAWALDPAVPSSFIPPLGYLIDFLPGSLLFGIGMSIVVAPLTTALMTSVPERRAGLASAINNAVSRVGPQLAGAALFVAITAAFYQDLSAKVGIAASSPALRAAVAPLNQPAAGASANLIAASRLASTDAFHLAMIIGAAMLLASAVVNAVGIRDDLVRSRTARAEGGDEGETASDAAGEVAEMAG